MFNKCFSSSHAHVSWQGRHVTDTKEFENFLAGPVHRRLTDEEYTELFRSDIRALASTDMAIGTLEKLLAAEPSREPWEVGESLAECLLAEEYEIQWPWNTERDKRTPRASLPGADLVGLITLDGEVSLALGEVKTSGDKNTPPNVMTGSSGMIHQLDKLAQNLQIHHTLLKWLHARCKDTEAWPLYNAAVKSYLESKGRAIVLFGLLMRDTTPHELDLKNRAAQLVEVVGPPTRVELVAWYFPYPIQDWYLFACNKG